MGKNANYYYLIGLLGVLVVFKSLKKRVSVEKLSPNFQWSEFESKDGAIMPPDVRANIIELSKNLEVIRAAVGRPIRINSAYRSPAHNKQVGGVSGSQHQYGRAADIRVEGMGAGQLHAVVLDLINQGKIKQGGVGIYPTFVHYDIRGTKARWHG
jgi:uncharacterized protein YcbK (DUF882 family)